MIYKVISIIIMKKKEKIEAEARLRDLLLERYICWEDKTMFEKVAIKIEIIQLSKKLRLNSQNPLSENK